MAKQFAPRTSKKELKKVDLTEKIGKDIFRTTDEKLLQGARLDDVELAKIVVRDQVRTKFNDDSIKELAANIKTNGLIQPLVIHREGNKFVLICGERRYRAMSSIKMEKCPCFILENKTPQELMAIQFSENSAREALHYIDKADGILNYHMATKASERKIVDALGISKSEVHRGLIIARLPEKVKEAAKQFDIEKYVLLEYEALAKSPVKEKIAEKICEGSITKRTHLKRFLSAGTALSPKKKVAKTTAATPKVSANALLKILEKKSGELDAKTQKALQSLMEEARDILS